MKKVILLSCTTLFVVFTAYCQTTNIGKPGVYGFSFQLSHKHLAKCSISVVQYSREMLYDRRWGSDWDNPRTVIAGIKMWFDGRKVIVPLSSYTDLSNPDLAYFEATKSGYRLVISGGDAATAYDATIDFSDHKASKRVVRSGEFPNEAWEMTTYSKPDTIR